MKRCLHEKIAYPWHIDTSSLHIIQNGKQVVQLGYHRVNILNPLLFLLDLSGLLHQLGSSPLHSCNPLSQSSRT